MLMSDWIRQQSGTIVKVPKGTKLGDQWWYQANDGTWRTDTDAWKEARGDAARRQLRDITTDRDYYIDVILDAGALMAQALKAIRSRSGRARDGGLSMKRTKGR